MRTSGAHSLLCKRATEWELLWSRCTGNAVWRDRKVCASHLRLPERVLGGGSSQWKRETPERGLVRETLPEVWVLNLSCFRELPGNRGPGRTCFVLGVRKIPLGRVGIGVGDRDGETVEQALEGSRAKDFRETEGGWGLSWEGRDKEPPQLPLGQTHRPSAG